MRSAVMSLNSGITALRSRSSSGGRMPSNLSFTSSPGINCRCKTDNNIATKAWQWRIQDLAKKAIANGVVQKSKCKAPGQRGQEANLPVALTLLAFRHSMKAVNLSTVLKFGNSGNHRCLCSLAKWAIVPRLFVEYVSEPEDLENEVRNKLRPFYRPKPKHEFCCFTKQYVQIFQRQGGMANSPFKYATA